MSNRTLESYFIDWEGEAFGFGYGSGEPHIIPALRHFFEMVPPPSDDRPYSNGGPWDYVMLEKELTPIVAWLLINVLGKTNVIEYGSSPRGAWLTQKGYRLQAFVLSKTADELIDLATVFDQEQPHCGPRCCNCGPNGYEEGKLCPNPFYHDKIA